MIKIYVEKLEEQLHEEEDSKPYSKYGFVNELLESKYKVEGEKYGGAIGGAMLIKYWGRQW